MVYIQPRSNGMVCEALAAYYLSRDSSLVNSVWYGVQASIGGDCMKVMLRAMWPSVNNIRKPAHDMSSRPCD